jgi:hypothetical protein
VSAIVAALENSTDSTRFGDLNVGLAAVAAHLTPEKAAPLAGRLVTVLESEPNSDRLAAMAKGLAAVAEHYLPKTPRLGWGGSVGVVAALEKEIDSHKLSVLAEGLATVAAHLPSAQQTLMVAMSNLLLREVPSLVNGNQKAQQIATS